MLSLNTLYSFTKLAVFVYKSRRKLDQWEDFTFDLKLEFDFLNQEPKNQVIIIKVDVSPLRKLPFAY